MKILIIGYFGRKNLGDDLMLSNLLNYICSEFPNVKVSVVLHDITSFNFDDREIEIIASSNKIEYLKAIIRANVLIWGGGTCFYDSGTSIGNRGLTDLVKIGILCRVFNVKFYFLGVGIGKVTKKVKSKLKVIFKLANYIYFRENKSIKLAKDMMAKRKIGRSGDLALLKESLEVDLGNLPNKVDYITFSGVYGYEVDEKVIARLLDSASKKYNAKIVFLPCHRSIVDDNILHNNIAKIMNRESDVLDINTIDEYISVIKGSVFHFGIRLHSIVLADMYGVPNLGIEYSPKIRNYIDSTSILIGKRCFKDANEVSLQDVDYIMLNYKKPDLYIKNENSLTIQAISRIVNEN